MGTPGSQGSGGCKSGWKGGSPLWHILPPSKLSRNQPTKHYSAMHLIPWLPIYPTWLTLFSRDKHNLIASLKINDCRVYVLSKRRFQGWLCRRWMFFSEVIFFISGIPLIVYPLDLFNPLPATGYCGRLPWFYSWYFSLKDVVLFI